VKKRKNHKRNFSTLCSRWRITLNYQGVYFFTLKYNKNINRVELDFQHIPLIDNKYPEKFISKAQSEYRILTE